jgi:hypothetical protein
VRDLVSIDFFTVPTATFRVLFVFVVLCHNRRRVVHFNVTEHPSAEWTAQQMVDVVPWDTAPRYVLRDRDQIYGAYFDRRGPHCRWARDRAGSDGTNWRWHDIMDMIAPTGQTVFRTTAGVQSQASMLIC